MAKGNTGNFLQHFVALHAARRLADVVRSFAYVDLFAMRPWETFDRPQADFRRLFDTLGKRPEDPVASAFVAAIAARGARGLDEYPNTSVLLLHAGITLSQLTVCEIDDLKRADLERCLGEHERGVPVVPHGNCTKARLAACSGAALVMMDPEQVDIVTKGDGTNGHISIDKIRGALGNCQLDLLGRAKQPAADPCIVTIFSYSEQTSKAHETDRALQREIGKIRGWRISRIVEPTMIRTGAKRPGLHQAWWCASRDSVAAPTGLQEAWDAWKRFG